MQYLHLPPAGPISAWFFFLALCLDFLDSVTDTFSDKFIDTFFDTFSDTFRIR